LVRPTSEMQRVIGAVADGDLSKPGSTDRPVVRRPVWDSRLVMAPLPVDFVEAGASCQGFAAAAGSWLLRRWHGWPTPWRLLRW
jgi:hypothetical protein